MRWTFGWLLAGGAPTRWARSSTTDPSLRYSHAMWHLFVVAGSVCHYIAVMAQVAAAVLPLNAAQRIHPLDRDFA